MLDVTRMLAVAHGDASVSATARRVPGRFARNGVPPVVVYNVCRHCNMRCPHCYAAASSRPSPRDLDTPGALRVLDALAQGGVSTVIFSGGEPLMRGDLFLLLEWAQRLGLRAHLSCNGVFVDADVAARLGEVGVGYVGVSIDGRPSFNDRYRGLDNAFDRAVGGIVASREAGLRTGLRMTVTNRNYRDLPLMLDLAVSLGVDRFYVSHLVYAGRAARGMDQDLTPARSRALLDDLFERAEALRVAGARTHVVTGGNDSDGPALVEWLVRRQDASAAERVQALLEARGGNSAGQSLLCVDSEGNVHPDQFWRRATLGNLVYDDLDEILRHPLLTQLADRADLLSGRCGACWYQGLCRGSHRERALAATGDLWASDPACVLTDAEVYTRGARPMEAIA